jgi:hypothetical protein
VFAVAVDIAEPELLLAGAVELDL